MRWAADDMRRHAPLAVVAGLVVVGVLLLAAGIASGAVLILLGLAFLALRHRRLFLIVGAGLLPLTTIGWLSPLAVIEGRTLDARLLLTFGIAGLGAAAIALDRRRLTRTELLFLVFIAYVALVGIFRSDSYLTWGPQVARLTAAFSAFVLARTHLTTMTLHSWLGFAVMIGFGVPSVVGVSQFLVGAAGLLNEATRATGLDRASPVALAFAGQMALMTAYAAVASLPTTRHRRLFAAVLGVIAAGAIIASATRLVLVTAWAGLASFETWRRRWRLVAAITLVLAVTLLARPDFTGRFADVVRGPDEPPAVAPGEPAPGSSGSEAGDASLRFRLVVWTLIIEEWAETPVLGIGPGMTARVVAASSPAQRTAPHNDYIGVLAESGLIGLGLYVAIQLAVLLALWRRLRITGSVAARQLRAMAAVAFVAFNVLGVLNNPMYFLDIQFALWALVGSALASWKAGPPVERTT